MKETVTVIAIIILDTNNIFHVLIVQELDVKETVSVIAIMILNTNYIFHELLS